MEHFVYERRCNGLLRRDPDPLLNPLQQTSKRLPKWHWVGGRLTVTKTDLLFDGFQMYGEGSTTFREERDFNTPLSRIVDIRKRRGPLIARFIAIEINDGSRLHLRPTKLTETFDLLAEALEKHGEELERQRRWAASPENPANQ